MPLGISITNANMSIIAVFMTSLSMFAALRGVTAICRLTVFIVRKDLAAVLSLPALALSHRS